MTQKTGWVTSLVTDIARASYAKRSTTIQIIAAVGPIFGMSISFNTPPYESMN